MGHAAAIIERLPQLYRDGELIEGILNLPALQLEILDEEALDVRRAHWFDAALELDEVAGLAALLDIIPEPWQTLAEFRVWVRAIRNARLRFGAVTREAIEMFVAEYAGNYQDAVDIAAVPPITSWADEPPSTDAIFLENPPRRAYQRATPFGGIEPLHHFEIVQRGLDEAQAGFLLVGLPSAPESVPVIANVTSGQALIFLGNVPPGARLWLRPTDDGGVHGQLENEDVSDRLRSVSGLVPGQHWSQESVEQPAKAITLRRGKNELWFLPIAHFDSLGLDRFLLALPDLLMSQGRYDETAFNQALFYQDPAVILRTIWTETEPASFEVHLPAGNLLSGVGDLNKGLESRDRLDFSLNQALHKLRAAGVASKAFLQPHAESQGQLDYLMAVLPVTQREVGPMGADRLTDAGGVFEVTGFDDSTFG